VWHEGRNILRRRESYDIESLRDPLPAVAAWCCFARELVGDVNAKLATAYYRRVARTRVARARRHPACLARRLHAARSILFVCTGNIHRSLFAEARLASLLDAGHGSLQVASAGVSTRPGRPPSPLGREVAAEFGVDLGPCRSRVLTRQQLRTSDVVCAMDASHLQAIARLDRASLDRTMLLAALDAQPDFEIPDPFGHDGAAHRQVYQRIDGCVRALHEALRGPRPSGQPAPQTTIPHRTGVPA
jgi:protein-tyrosine phosphatase